MTSVQVRPLFLRKLSNQPLALFFENTRISPVDTLTRHAEQLSALGHPVRLLVLRFVVQGGPAGTAAGAIQAHVDVPASTLSHHLKRLVDAGLLHGRAEGTYLLYAPDFDALKALTGYLWEDCCKRGTSSCC